MNDFNRPRIWGEMAAAISPNITSTTSSSVIVYHGTDLQSALSLANGAALDAKEAANNKFDGPAGFFLATDIDSATVFALRRGRGAIVTYDITEGALAELGASGAQLQDIAPGKFNTFPGYELVIPPATFGTFNRLLGNGQIKPGIVSSPKKEDPPAPSPKEKPQ